MAVIAARTWMAWLLLLTCETICQISLKMAGRATGPFDFSPDAFLRALTTGWLWVAIACYIGAFLAWLTILRRSTLSSAFATSAIVFVAVMCSSWLVFGERVGAMQVMGSLIILVGIFMLGADSNPDAAHNVPPSTARPGSR
ncbi:MAG TPA: EamA family transporter [Rudaea sp.]|nr:EamA family transporter [Rudaea sp.]